MHGIIIFWRFIWMRKYKNLAPWFRVYVGTSVLKDIVFCLITLWNRITCGISEAAPENCAWKIILWMINFVSCLLHFSLIKFELFPVLYIPASWLVDSLIFLSVFILGMLVCSMLKCLGAHSHRNSPLFLQKLRTLQFPSTSQMLRLLQQSTEVTGPSSWTENILNALLRPLQLTQKVEESTEKSLCPIRRN